MPVSLTQVIQELLVGEAVRMFTCPALYFQVRGQAVPRRVSDAATPRGLLDPQQLTHMSRDDLQGAHSRVESFDKVCVYSISPSFDKVVPLRGRVSGRLRRSHPDWGIKGRSDKVILPKTNASKDLCAKNLD